MVSGIAGAILFTYVSPSNVKRFQTIATSFKAFVLGQAIEDRALTPDETSARERSLKNKHTWGVIKMYPIIGAGLNPNDNLYPEEYIKAQGKVHCEILAAGRQMGFPGMGIYLAMVISTFVIGRRTYKRFNRYWQTVADLGWLMCLQMVVFVVAGSFSPAVWNYPFLILTGSASAMWLNLKSYAPQPAAVPGDRGAAYPQTQTTLT